MKRRFVIYRRVSSAKQADNYSMESQMRVVQSYLDTLLVPYEIIATFDEVETGSNDDRPKLKEAIRLAQASGGTIVIGRLDRIGRSLKLLIALTSEKVSFVSAENPHCDNFTAKIMMCCAERERELIKIRVTQGLQIAKERGVLLGNRTNPKEAWQGALKAISERKRAFNEAALKEIRAIQSTGVSSLYQTCRFLNLRGVKTSRGKTWTATAVKRVIESAGA